MGIYNWILLLTRPTELWSLLQFYMYYQGRSKAMKKHPAWERRSMQRCWELLSLTSTSAFAIIKVLDADLAQTVCIYFGVMRGLDTVEDDMTISDEVKLPMLRAFHSYIVTPGWTFDGCGPNEKHRQLLLDFDNLVEEVNLLAPEAKSILVDLCRKMGNGMADFAHAIAVAGGTISLDTIADYEDYGRCVAGLGFEGLTRLFSASGREDPWTDTQMELCNSLGLLFQKADIICDYHDDIQEGRYFWPKEIWARPEFGGFSETKDLHEAGEREELGAMYALSGMTVDALRHATDALDFLLLLKDPGIFHFYAIFATIGMATLELCFMNNELFKKHITFRKVDLARLLLRSTNLQEVTLIFCEYARKIQAKTILMDPNFVQISMACRKIEQWREVHYPSLGPSTSSREKSQGTSGGAAKLMRAVVSISGAVLVISVLFASGRLITKFAGDRLYRPLFWQ